MHYYHEHFWGMHMWWWIIFIIIVVFIIIRSLKTDTSKSKENTPLSILKKRFAKGEITKEEFEEAKRILEDD